ncbi:MAG: DUF4280 domain-containing protein [Alphaproteobacteria bacterium]|nr:DUF4280 domain-containing protein [Alphaproteobacteria bacterium]
MGMQATGLALTRCSFGMAPMPFITIPMHRDITFIMPAATIMDHMPFLNILPFIMCQSKANPMVIAIMAATLGAVQVAPCIPMTFAPWVPSPTVTIDGMPAANNSAKTLCLWGGCISFLFPGQVTTLIP